MRRSSAISSCVVAVVLSGIVLFPVDATTGDEAETDMVAVPRAITASDGNTAPGRGRRLQDVPPRLWSTPVTGSTEALLLPRPGLLVRLTGQVIEGYDTATGRRRWNLPREGARGVRVVAADDGTVVVLQRFDRPPPSSGLVSGASYRLRTVTPGEGTIGWDTGAVAGDCISVSIASAADRLLLLVRTDAGESALFALSLEQGRVVWEAGFAPLPGTDGNRTPDFDHWYAIEDDVLYRLDRREPTLAVSALSLESGDLRWVGYLSGEAGGPDHRIFCFEGNLLVSGENLSSLDPVNGAIRWSLEGRWEPLELKAPWLLAGTAEGDRLQMLHAVTGEERWRSAPRVEIPAGAPVVWNAEGILSPAPGGAATLLSATTGRDVEESRGAYRPLRNGIEMIAAYAGGLVFVTLSDQGGAMVRLDARANRLWNVPLPGYAGSPLHPALVSAPLAGAGNGAVAVVVTGTDQACALMICDLAGGAELARYALEPGQPLFVAEPAAGRLYFIDAGGELAAAGR